MALSDFVINTPSGVCKNPTLFFDQLDLFFDQKGISRQEDMLGYVALVLSQDVISEAREIIIPPPAEKLYDKLCDKITARVTMLTHKSIAHLLEQETLGDGTLS